MIKLISLTFSFLFLAPLYADPSKRNYAEVQNYLRNLSKQNPATTNLFELGDSDSGQKILGVKIGSGSVKNIVVATHHGNEYGSTEVALAFASSVAANPIAGQSMFVVPVLNIDGYEAKRRWEMKSGKYHDPNRDYPGACGTEGPFALKSTHALADFIDREGIVNSATLHTFFPAVVYPWGLSSHDLSTPYDDLFKFLVGLAVQESGYQTGNSTEVVYAADGTYEDYAFWKHGIWSILFELGYSHSPSQGDVDKMNQVNIPGLRRMFERSPDRRADDHAFKGRCDSTLAAFDRHDE